MWLFVSAQLSTNWNGGGVSARAWNGVGSLERSVGLPSHWALLRRVSYAFSIPKEFLTQDIIDIKTTHVVDEYWSIK